VVGVEKRDVVSGVDESGGEGELCVDVALTTGNIVFTESWKLRREPNLQLSVKPLFAESTRSGSRRRTGPR
jgi:hypothetical protein